MGTRIPRRTPNSTKRSQNQQKQFTNSSQITLTKKSKEKEDLQGHKEVHKILYLEYPRSIRRYPYNLRKYFGQYQRDT